MENFNAKVVVLEKQQDNTWKEYTTTVHNSKEMIDIVGQGVAQVNISKYMKLYFSTEGIERWGGVQSKYKNETKVEYMASPLLLVECDDDYPIDITSNTIDTIKEGLILY